MEAMKVQLHAVRNRIRTTYTYYNHYKLSVAYLFLLLCFCTKLNKLPSQPSLFVSEKIVDRNVLTITCRLLCVCVLYRSYSSNL